MTENDDATRQAWIDEYAGNAPFEASAHYDADGDCIEFLVTNEPFYARRIDQWVTVFYSRATHEVIGSLIKDVRQLLRRFPMLGVFVTGNEIDLLHVLMAPACESADIVVQTAYTQVLEKAKNFNLRTPVAVAA